MPTEAPVIALKEAPVMAIKPTGETIPMIEVVELPRARTAGLPKTASAMPFLALMGFLSLGTGFTVKRLCER